MVSGLQIWVGTKKKNINNPTENKAVIHVQAIATNHWHVSW